MKIVVVAIISLLLVAGMLALQTKSAYIAQATALLVQVQVRSYFMQSVVRQALKRGKDKQMAKDYNPFSYVVLYPITEKIEPRVKEAFIELVVEQELIKCTVSLLSHTNELIARKICELA